MSDNFERTFWYPQILPKKRTNKFSLITVRDHPFKTSALLRGGGVKNLPYLPTDSSKKLPTVGG